MLKLTYVLAAADEGDWDGIESIFKTIAGFLWDIAPALIFVSFAIAALLWTVAGHSQRMVELAKKQLAATLIGATVIAGFLVIKGLIQAFSLGGF